MLIFRHLKLEIASAIPASNVGKWVAKKMALSDELKKKIHPLEVVSCYRDSQLQWLKITHICLICLIKRHVLTHISFPIKVAV